MMSNGVLGLARVCAPKCLSLDSMQVSASERACLSACVKSFHGTQAETLHFLERFEQNEAVRVKVQKQELKEKQEHELAL